jgi:hypothetical protein
MEVFWVITENRGQIVWEIVALVRVIMKLQLYGVRRWVATTPPGLYGRNACNDVPVLHAVTFLEETNDITGWATVTVLGFPPPADRWENSANEVMLSIYNSTVHWDTHARNSGSSFFSVI